MVQTMKQAAEYEQKIAWCQAGVKKLNDVVYTAPSETERVPHIITVNPETGLAQSCSCDWFVKAHWRLHKCAHAQAAERYIAAEEAIEEAEAYIRLRDGSLVQAQAQLRGREKREFSLFR